MEPFFFVYIWPILLSTARNLSVSCKKLYFFAYEVYHFFGFFVICSTLVRDPKSTQQAGNIVNSVSDSRTLVLQENDFTRYYIGATKGGQTLKIT